MISRLPITFETLAPCSTASRVPELRSALRALDPACARGFFTCVGDGQTDASGGGSGLRIFLKAFGSDFVGSKSNPTAQFRRLRRISSSVYILHFMERKARASVRLQRLDWSDPNVHLAPRCGLQRVRMEAWRAGGLLFTDYSRGRQKNAGFKSLKSLLGGVRAGADPPAVSEGH